MVKKKKGLSLLLICCFSVLFLCSVTKNLISGKFYVKRNLGEAKKMNQLNYES